MKFKLDENLGQSVSRRLTAAKHDVSTIVDQQMAGVADAVVYRTCTDEGRVLVTLDLDFATRSCATRVRPPGSSCAGCQRCMDGAMSPPSWITW
ncbi:MAG: DUF5615 family PIN-like protein [Actinomycetota bacterium]